MTSVTRRGPLTRVRAVATAMALAAAMSTGLTAGVAGAAPAGAFKLSGAVKGTLHFGASGDCAVGAGLGMGFTDLVGSTSDKKAAKWIMAVTGAGASHGTFTITAGGSFGGQLDPLTKHADVHRTPAEIFNATSGTFTLNHLKGTLNVTFGVGQKAIKVAGSWNCARTS